MKRVVLLAGVALFMAACSEAPSAPGAVRKAPSARPSHDDDITCRSGYTVAYDEQGNPICVPDPDGGGTSSMTSPSGPSGPPGPPGP